MFRLTLRKSLLTVIVAIGLSGIVALTVNSRNFLNIAYETQTRSTNRVIHNNIANAMHELRRLSAKMGFDLQREDAFIRATENNDIVKIQHTFDDQFAQYYTTANILSLQKIYYFDESLKLLTMSTQGYKVLPQQPIICQHMLQTARPRQGAERSKRLEELCTYNETAFHATLLPVGLIPKAYIMIITDPTFSLKEVESAVGSPLKVLHPSGKVAYKSPKWPNKEHLHDYLLVEHKHAINYSPISAPRDLDKNEVAFTVLIAESTSYFNDKIQRSVNLSTMVTGAFFLTALLLAILILNLTLRPLSNLQRAAKDFLKGKKESIKESGFAEIADVTRAYNSMTSNVSDLIEQLEESRNKEKLANIAKSHFLANVSHELRTPLSAIIGYSEMLRDDQPSEEKVHQYLDTIIHSGSHLQQLINDILDMSKVEAGKLEIEKISFDLREFLLDVTSILNIAAKQKNLQFETKLCTPVPQTICSDPLRIRQILINLCGNAFKFTEQGTVTIEIEFFEEVNKLLFRIKDTGTGIVQSEIDKLFKPFQQATNMMPKKYGGTGLGLALSKQLVQLLGGDISVTSKPGVGSIFTFNINTGKLTGNKFFDDLDTDMARDHEQRPPQFLQRLCGRVLVAEDNPTLQDLIKVQLSHTRAQVSVAHNGLEALQQASQFDFDLILMDMQMPMMDGIKATQEMRKLGISTPIYALTANAMVEEKEKYLAIGCDGYLAKPIDKKKFYQTLMETLPLVNTRATDDSDESEDLSQVIRLFKDSIPTTQQKLRNLAELGDCYAIREALHELKAIAGSLDYSELARCAADLEQAARTQQIEQLLKGIPHLCELLDEI